MDPRQIYIFSGIDEFSAEFIIRQLLTLDRQSNEQITMIINSPGGYVNEMFAIIDTMNAVQSPIRTVVMGMAASAAACIASAGDTRLITENAQYMLHEASAMNWGSMTTMQENLQQSLKQNEKMFNILSQNTKQTVDTLKAITNKTDKYFSANEAVQFGLADKVIGTAEAQALKLSEPINVEGHEFSTRADGLSEVQILKEGSFEHPIYGKVLISEDNLRTMQTNFDTRVRGIDISIDYTHDNDGGENPAACWVKALELRQCGKVKGLFAIVEFTPKGKKLAQEKEYKYASADFLVDYVNEQGKHFPYVLRGGTLTNRPFIKEMHPIKLSEYEPTKKEIKDMSKEQLMAALKAEGIDVATLQTESASLKGKITELENKIRELSALPATKDSEIKALKDQLAELTNKIASDAKEAAFNSLVSQGKVVPAQKEGVLKLFETAEAMSAFYKDALPVVKMSADGSESSGADETLTEDEQKVVASGASTKEEIIANRKVKPSGLKKKK